MESTGLIKKEIIIMVITVAIIIAVTILGSVAMICFRGITFYKKMEVVQSQTQNRIERPLEMDEIEKKLNKVDEINNARPQSTVNDSTEIKSETVSAMDNVLRTLQEVFGPEVNNK